MVGGNFSTRKYYFRRCKRVRWNWFESIPDELLFAIVLRLQAQDIYFGARLVCWKWYHMTHTQYFIRAHLEHATYGLLYVDNMSKDVVFISPRKDGRGIHTYKLNYKINGVCSFMCSCNGLILEYDCEFYYVTNVSTGQTFRLPPLPPTLQSCIFSGMGYDVASMTYKVVISLLNRENWQFGLGILTVGVDKSWRCVRIDHLSPPYITSKNCPIVTKGFLVWINSNGSKLVTLDLETEIMTEVFPPVVLLEKEKHTWPPSVLLKEENYKQHVYCLSTGRLLTYFLRRGKFQWEVFEVTPKTVEWRKLFNICLEGQKHMLKMLGFNFQRDEADIKPCGWLKYPEILALSGNKKHDFMIFYNLVTCEISAESLPIRPKFMTVTLHKNSLVQLGGTF